MMLWTSVAILGCALLAESVKLRLYRGSLEKYYSVQLNEAPTLLNSSYFNESFYNLFYAFGYRNNPDDRNTRISLKAMISLPSRNVFLVDWSKEANSTTALGDPGIEATYLIKSLPETLAVGAELGAALLNMTNYGFDLNKTHLTGHSLGAQMIGNAGRYVISNGNGKIIDRITGLDPAGPLYEKDFRLLPPLDKNCASFVVTLHTDPGGYGINASLATVDIWANFENFISRTTEQQVQLGCPIGDFGFMTTEDLCSHVRACYLMAETRYLNQTLMASQASNYYEWKAGNTTHIISLGEDMDRSAKGDFFLVTNSKSPFGKGSAGLKP